VIRWPRQVAAGSGREPAGAGLGLAVFDGSDPKLEFMTPPGGLLRPPWMPVRGLPAIRRATIELRRPTAVDRFGREW